MPAYAIYDPSTGAVASTLTINNVDEAALEALVVANTPAGKAVVDVTDPDHPVLTNNSAWTVSNGALTAVTPSAAELLATAKADQQAILQASYDNARTQNVAYMNTSFMADTESQQTFAHALLAYQSIGSTPSDFYAVDASYKQVPMNLTQLQGLIAAIAAQVWSAFQTWVTVKQQLASAATVAEVQAIVWPSDASAA